MGKSVEQLGQPMTRDRPVEQGLLFEEFLDVSGVKGCPPNPFKVLLEKVSI
jgi:hypothetical protein